MGQQQLLLVILVTIVVGIAAVVAINTFSNSAENANRDAVRNDLGAIALSSQAYYMRPGMLGGGDKSFTGFTFNGIAFPGLVPEDAEDLVISNENGTYTITSAAGNELIIEGNPAQSDDVLLVATIRPNEYSIEVTDVDSGS